jgi:putative acetyltransferase
MSPSRSIKLQQIQPATADDLHAIHQVHVQAFGGREQEAHLVDLLHAAQKGGPSLIATLDRKIVAHIVFSPATIEPARDNFKVTALGPIAVLPAHQRRGIGSRLIRAGIEACIEDQYDAVVVLGNPNLYSRFGFRPAMSYGLTNEYVHDGHFMIMELRSGALVGVSGLLKYAPEFQTAGC